MASPIKVVGVLLRWTAPIIVIAGGALVARQLIAQRQAPPKIEPPPRVLPVDVITVDQRDNPASLQVFGSVRPLRTLVLRPTVGGPIQEIHPELLEGGLIGEGETILRVDRRDYLLALDVARSNLVAAQADLDIELGSAAVAAREWKLLEGSIEVTDAGRKLALREPYLARRRSEVESARTRVAQAELDLERTEIKAPFNALVLSETAEVGGQAVVGAELARMVDRSRFAVEVSVPAERLALLQREGATARILLPNGEREGTLERVLGEVDAEGRMTRLQVTINDPLGSTDPGGTPQQHAPAVLLGAYAEVLLPCRPIEGSISVPRAALREGDSVWVADANDELQIRQVDVVMRRPDDVLVVAGLKAGERVITSAVAVPLPGLKLAPRTKGAGRVSSGSRQEAGR
jgi:RND family efflux transporter MFP subunit